MRPSSIPMRPSNSAVQRSTSRTRMELYAGSGFTMEHGEDGLEGEIQKQLDELLVSHDGEESYTEDETLEEFCDNQDDNGNIPETFQKYFNVINKRSENLRKDLDECEHVLEETTHDCGDESFFYESAEMKEIAFILGEDPEELRDRVLYEVDKEDKTELDLELVKAETTDSMQLVPVTLEHQALQQLLALDDKLKRQDLDMKREIQQRLEEQSSRDHKRHEERLKRQTQHEEEMKQLHQAREILQAKAQDEIELKSRQTQEMLAKYQADIEKFAKETLEEKLDFENRMAAEQRRRETQQLSAATHIQAVYRSYRVRKKYMARLKRLREEREERRLQQRQMEIVASRRAEEQRRKKEKQEIKKKEEMERKRQEEIKKRAEEKRLEDEKLEKEKQRQEKERIEKIQREKMEEEKKREEEKMRREKDLENQTQEILAKIQDEKMKSCSYTVSGSNVKNSPTGADKQTNSSQDESLHDIQNVVIATCKALSLESSFASVVASDENTHSVSKSSHSAQDGHSRDVKNVVSAGSFNNEGNSFASGERGDENTATKNAEKVGVQACDECLSDVKNVKHAICEAGDSERTDKCGMEKTSFENTEQASILVQSESQNVSKLGSNKTKETPTETRRKCDGNDTTKLPPVDKTSNQLNFNENNVCKSTNIKVSQTSSHCTQCGSEELPSRTCETENRNLESACRTKNDSCTSEIKSDVNVFSKSNTDSEPGSNAIFVTENKISNSDNQVGMKMSDVDKRRLQWTQNCTAYRSLVNGISHDESRRPLRRVPGASKLPPLMHSQLLAVSQPHQTLAQVTVVMAENAAPCSLSSLTACPLLQCLHVQHSGVKLLEGLHQSPEITYVNLESNQVEGVHCRDRPNLNQMILNHNKLTSVHGFEGCTKLRRLELAHNNITRTDGLASLTSLTHLDLSHNQLVSISGIGHLVHLQDLNLSHNHLSTVGEVHSCCLLRRLVVQSNSLVEVPSLDNHVLLRDLRLDDNSLCQIDPLSQAWLPLLQFLSVAQNGLTDLPNLRHCVMLQKVDISQNCITDTDVIIDALKDCHYLEELQIQDNPLQQEENYRHALLDGLPKLQVLDSQVIHESFPRQPRTAFDAMCLSQLTADDRLHAMRDQHAKLQTDIFASRILHESTTSSVYFECSLQLALKHRYMHEAGSISEINPMSPDSAESTFREYLSSQQNSFKMESCSPECDHFTQDRTTDVLTKDGNQGTTEQVLDPRHSLKTDRNQNLSSKCDACRSGNWSSESGCLCKNGHRKVSLHECEISISNVEHVTTESLPQKMNESREAAATIIQAGWRGYTTRREIVVNTKRWLAALCIQTLWRGYVVRKKFARARQAALYVDSEDDGSFGYDDVDPTSWDFAQTNVDTDWLPAESPCIPMAAPRLPAMPMQPNYYDTQTDYHTRQLPKEAWHDVPASSRVVRDMESPVSVVNKPPLPPVQTCSAADTPRTVRSHRQEKITEEWGFKDSTTAELMMKRAKKLSRGLANKKKSLDPLQRYQQMKKIHDSTKVVSACKKGVQRQEFFQAREDAIQKAAMAQRKEKDHKAARTFEWVHSYGVMASDALQEHNRHTYSISEPNLPRISPTALQGRVQLMASPTLDLQSVDGDSSVSSHRPRSQSLSTHGHERIRLPAVKTSSAPTERRRERLNESTWLWAPGSRNAKTGQFS